MTHTPDPARNREVRHGTARESLRSFSGLLAAGMGVFAAVNSVRLPPQDVVQVVTFNLLVVTTCLGVRLALTRNLIPKRWANPSLAGLLGLATANVLFTFSLLADPVQTIGVAALQIAAGCLLLSHRWMGTLTIAVLLSWFLVAESVTASNQMFLQLSAIILGAALVSMIIHSIRFRAHRTLDGALDTARKEVIERQQAEQKLQEAYDEMEQRVARRTADLFRANEQLQEEIADRQQAEKALRESEALFRAISEQLPDGLLLVDWNNLDAPGKIIHANPTALKMHGYTLEEMIGLPITHLSSAGGKAAVLERSRQLRAGKTLVFETVHHRKDGQAFPVEIVGRMIEYDGRSVSLGISRDISERKRAEEEQRQLMVQVQAGQKLESLGVLAGGIAHDFNNLLAAILGNTGLALEKTKPGAAARPFIDQIEKTTQRAAELVDQMLAYSGQGNFSVERIHLSHLVHEMVDLLKTSISKKAKFELRLEEEIPTIEVDATQIRQVVMNLITNASDALAESNGTIAVTVGLQHTDRTFLETTYLNNNLPAGPYVYLEVKDTGYGMDQETQEKLFDPFFTTKKTGRGLGMAAVLGIVRGHNGAIHVVSEIGQGSTFRILFPAESVDQFKEEKEILDDAALPQKAPEKGRLVLLVDDEEAIRLVARAVLEKVGFEVKTAADGREALEIFRHHADAISVVLLDLSMPRLSGQETFLEMRHIDPEVKVVMMSGFNEKNVMKELPTGQLAGFLKKPFQVTDLTQTISDALK